MEKHGLKLVVISYRPWELGQVVHKIYKKHGGEKDRDKETPTPRFDIRSIH